MPKLTQERAQQVASAGQGSGLIPVGNYRAKLNACEAKLGAQSGNPYWSWEYELLEDSGYGGRKLYDNTSLAEQAQWRLDLTFSAFNVPNDTDTNDLLGCTVMLRVTEREISAGSRQGQLANNIAQVLHDEHATAVRGPGYGQRGTDATAGSSSGSASSAVRNTAPVDDY